MKHLSRLSAVMEKRGEKKMVSLTKWVSGKMLFVVFFVHVYANAHTLASLILIKNEFCLYFSLLLLLDKLTYHTIRVQ